MEKVSGKCKSSCQENSEECASSAYYNVFEKVSQSIFFRCNNFIAIENKDMMKKRWQSL